LLRKKDCCTYSLLLVTNKGLLYLFIVTTQQDALTQYKDNLYRIQLNYRRIYMP
jgi:hypothetical protein